MRYRDEVRLAMKRYPTLYADKMSVAHHLFFVNGNGMEWVNGELISDWRYRQTKEDKERRSAWMNADWYRPPEPVKYLYPICEYACIMHVPDDVKTDWLWAAMRAIVWAWEKPMWPLSRDPNDKLEYRENEHARNKEYLIYAKVRIQQMLLRKGRYKDVVRCYKEFKISL